jgi:hypothetical protein
MTSIKSLAIALTLLAATPFTHAQAPKSSLVMTDGKVETVAIETEPGLLAFADAYVAALRAKDVPKIKAMFHPQSLAAAMAFFAHQPAAPGQTKPTIESRLLKDPGPENHPPFIVHRYTKDSPAPQAGFMDYAVRPSHLLQFSWETAPDNSSTFIMHVVREDNRWFLVEGVPSAEFLKKMNPGK